MNLNRSKFTLALLGMLGLLLMGGSSRCSAQYVVSIRATRYTVLSNGKDRTQLRAEVRETSGKIVSNVDVQFFTSLGVLSQNRAMVFGGVAQTELSSSIAGVAKVTANVRGAVTEPIEIAFTDDPEALYQGSNYVEVNGSGYLAYSVADKVVESSGQRGGARVRYKNIDITADRMYVYADGLIVRAHGNVTLKRGKSVVKASRLVYRMAEGSGFGIVETNGASKISEITGQNLRVAPLDTQIPNSYLLLPTLTSKLVIAARGITFFPGDRIIFNKPKVIQDGQQIYSAAYHQMRFDSTELFAEQFVSVGTNGFALDLPVYYNLTPTSSGQLILHNQQQTGRGYFNQNNGFSADLIQSYNKLGATQSEGAYGFTGLTRGNWGFSWLHNQDFGRNTQGGFYLDFPQHSAVSVNGNLNQQQRFFRWGMNLTGGQTWIAPVATNTRSDIYAETQPRQLMGQRNLLYTFGTTFSNASIKSTSTLLTSRTDSSQQINMRAFTRPRQLDANTTLTNSFQVGQIWQNNGESGIATLASIGIDRMLGQSGTVGFSYDFVNQPAGAFTSTGQHRLGVTYNVVKGKKFSTSLFGSFYLDAPDANLYADMTYRLTNDWRVLFSGTLANYDAGSFRDLQFTLGRRLGAREIQLTYSTFYKRVSLDFTATRF